MGRLMPGLGAVLAVVLAGLLLTSAEGADRTKKTATKTPKSTATKKSSSGTAKKSTTKSGGDEVYAVVQVDDEYRAVGKSALEDLRKDLDEKYKKELADYTKEYKEAVKEKQKLDRPKPTKPKVKMIKSGFKGKGEAEAYIQRVESGEERPPGA